MKVPSKGPRVVLPRGVDVKYPVNVSVYVPSAAVWSIPFLVGYCGSFFSIN